LGDGGCIYTLGLQPGTVIRCNHLHDVHRSPLSQAAPNNGMFIDEGSKGFHFERNVIYRTNGGPIRFNQCARDWHTWKDNLEGLPVPPILTPGKVGSALSCDGAHVFHEAPHSPALEPEQLTIEAWIKIAAFPGGEETRRWIVNKNGNEWVEGHYALLIQGDRAGGYLNIGGGRENHYAALSPAGALKIAEWQHLAMAYDGADLKVYVNGVQVASAAVNKKRKPGNSTLAIGRRQDAYNYFEGQIDEVRLYSRALAAGELKAHFEKPARIDDPKAENGLAGYWGFNERQGAVEESAKEIMEKAGLEPEYRRLLAETPPVGVEQPNAAGRPGRGDDERQER
jgi:hypothetical protein